MAWRFCGLLLLIGMLFGRSALPLSAQERPNDVSKPISKAEPVSFRDKVLPFLEAHCNRCHGTERPRGGLTLSNYQQETAARKDLKVWERVLQRIDAHEMPPPMRQQPKAEEVAVFRRWIDSVLGVDDCTVRKDPGRVTLRRLNRNEYNNTIRDLMGVDIHPADDFPADDVGYGFDNIGDVLSLPPILMEKYLASAERIIKQAFESPRSRKLLGLDRLEKGPDPAGVARILENLSQRAYRRPVQSQEVDRLMKLVKLAQEQGDPIEVGIQLAMEGILTSPHFLFKIERGQQGLQNAYHQITDYELATRLSYFLWSSMPDEELFKEARNRTLRRSLEQQTLRMLKDPKASALVENFAGQWLQLRNLKTFNPDPELFPTFDDKLRVAMQRETEMFFEAVMREDRGILDFLDADFTFVNERLARHYGIPGVKGDEFRRVSWAGVQRGGLLTQASILTVTSNPTRTSPVKRGKWILENIFATPPPPPPPNAGELSEDKDVVLSGSLRQRMEQHRANPNCATCHQRMDPLGFGLENFDAIGAWRDKDGKFPVDASGVLPDGKTFVGPRELIAILKLQKDAFAKCMAEKMLTYALGRGVESYDKCALEKITSALSKNQYRFSTLVLEVVKSDPFQWRRGRRGEK